MRLSGSWFELNGRAEGPHLQAVVHGIYRALQVFAECTGAETLRPYFVPGFGRYIDNNTWGFSYYLSFRIPVREKVFYPRKPKKKRDMTAPKPAAAQP
jgi:hypothetical protein